MCLFFFLRYFAFLVTYFCSWKSIFKYTCILDKYLSFFLWYFYFWQSVSNVRYLSFFLIGLFLTKYFNFHCVVFLSLILYSWQSITNVRKYLSFWHFYSQQSISNVIVLSFLSLILWFWHNVYLMLGICHSVSDIFIPNKVHPMLIYFTFFLMSLVLTKS